MKNAIIPCSPPSCHSPDWKKDLAQAVTDPLELLELLELTPEHLGYGEATTLFKCRVPRPFIQRMHKKQPDDPLFLQVWPHKQEFIHHDDYIADPLHEKQYNPIPGLLHKYAHRVLAIGAASCAINCRYCFRRAFPYEEQDYGSKVLDNWIAYLRQNKGVNEFILSGGEPLLLNDVFLEELAHRLQTETSVKRLRFHTRLPVVIPHRMTDRLLSLFDNIPLQWVMVLHINHPQEIDTSLQKAIQICRKTNITFLNQTVLLKSINDSSQILVELSEALFDMGVLPYYLHTLDKVSGTQHFAIEEKKAKTLHCELQRALPGFLVPKLVKEEPGMQHKTWL